MAFPRRTLVVLGVLSCALIALVSFRYLFGVGPVPPNVAGNALASPWLVLHVAGAAIALLLSPLQLLPNLRARAPRLHRWLGRLYVLGCTMGGVAGGALAWGSTAGPAANLGFGVLALTWLVTTTLGWLSAMRGQLTAHRAWMVRSFSLTYAAVTLRIYLALLPILPIEFMDGYRAIAFLCWVPNLVIAELFLRRAHWVGSMTSARRLPAAAYDLR
jgi:uncharacterized membrane protein